MSSEITQSMFFDAITQLRQDFRESHTRLRTDMTEGFHDLSTKLEQHAKDDQVVANRVLVIETERSGEKAATLKQGTWAALLGAAGLTAAWEGVKKLAGW